MKRAAASARRARPYPPPDLGLASRDDGTWPASFADAPEVHAWIVAEVLDPEGRLHNPDHRHIDAGDFAVMWAGRRAESKGMRIAGTMEKLQLQEKTWSGQRAADVIHGIYPLTPDHLMTLDAEICRTCGDAEFCALVEHELYHLGQVRDAMGAPQFDREGRPKLCIRGHDVEEFIGVVARYGTGHADSNLSRMIAAARAGPTVQQARISAACGVCALKLAA